MTLLHNRENEEHRFSRRLFLMGSAQAVLGLGLIGRLSYLSLMQDEKYNLLSYKNSTKIQFLLPQRGLIVDRNQHVIAASQYNYHLYLTQQKDQNTATILQRIQRLLQLDDQWLTTALTKFKGASKGLPILIYSPLTWLQVCTIEVHHQFLSGCDIEKNWIRNYPYGALFAHTVGYVQSPNGQEKLNPALLKIPGFQLGKVGLEKTYESQLQGVAGYKKVEIDAHHRFVQNLSEVKSQQGRTLKTTLDVTLQDYTYQVLQPFQSAAVTVLDIKTGQVLALCSQPSYDPNQFLQGIGKSEWLGLRDDPYTPLHNKVVQGRYPPGSIFKSLVALAAFESKLVPPQFSVNCQGYIEVGQHRFHCWHREGHGHLSIVQALKQSCDIYFYEVAKIIGMQRIIDCAGKFGMGALTGIEIDGENKGNLPSKESKKARYKTAWMLGDTVQLSIGQGDLLATPLQLATLMASLVNPAKQFVKPTLIMNHQPKLQKNHFDPQFLNLIKQGLDDTVNTPDGLAFKSRILKPGFEMGGKTSTAQVKRITMQERKNGVLTNEQRQWKDRDHAMFAGYAPIHNPRYAVAVVIEHGGSGGKVAAPLGRDILLRTQQIMGT